MAYLGLETIRRGKTAECIQDIFRLHFRRAHSVIDATYGKGRFWDWPHQLKVYGVDIDPQAGCCIRASYMGLPFRRQSVDVVCFDPPFIFTPGINRIIGTKRFFLGAESRQSDFTDDSARKRKWEAASHELHKPKNPYQLLRQTVRVMLAAKRIARYGLILKGQDLIVNKPDWWMYNVMRQAEAIGLGMPKDVLIQHSPAHRMRDPRWKHQYHFRRAHCYYIIYRWGTT